jgi:alpha-D-ribose 1-methylphosphonate 5-triphosphate diphosphatase PhnM
VDVSLFTDKYVFWQLQHVEGMICKRVKDKQTYEKLHKNWLVQVCNSTQLICRSTQAETNQEKKQKIKTFPGTVSMPSQSRAEGNETKYEIRPNMHM